MGRVQWKQVSFSGCSLKKVCCSQILPFHFFVGVSRGVGGNKRESPFKNKVILEQIGKCVSLGACLPDMHRPSLYSFFIAFVPFPLRCLNLNLFTFHSHRLYMQKSQSVYLFNDCTICKMWYTSFGISVWPKLPYLRSSFPNKQPLCHDCTLCMAFVLAMDKQIRNRN